MIRRVSPQRTTCSQAARAGTIWSSRMGESRSARMESLMWDPSASEIFLDVQKCPFGFQSRVPDCIVLRRDGATPRADTYGCHCILRAIIEHVGAVGQHDDEVHFGAQLDGAVR